MDDRTFKREMHHLKQQIADLARRRQAQTINVTCGTPQPRYDTFSEQMGALKAQMEGLDRELQSEQQETSRLPSSTAHSYPHSPQAPFTWDNASTSPAHPSDSPSCQQLWQFFTSLRDDVHSIDSRVESLERSASSTEDDQPRPQFTPTSSTIHSDSGASPSHPLRPPSRQEQPSGNNAASKVRRIHGQGQCSPLVQVVTDSASDDQQRAPAHRQTTDIMEPKRQAHEDQMLRQKIKLADVTMTTLKRYNATMKKKTSQLDSQNGQLACDIVALNARLHGVKLNRPEARSSQPPSKTHVDFAWEGPLRFDSLFGSGSQELIDKEPGSPHKMDEKHEVPVPPEGVAFRNQEITRLDEQLYRTQDALRASEQSLAEKEKELEVMRADHEGHADKTQGQGGTSPETQYLFNHAQAVGSGDHRETLLAQQDKIVQLRDAQRWKDREIERLATDCEQMHGVLQRTESEFAEAKAYCKRLSCESQRQKSDYDERKTRMLAELHNEQMHMRQLFEENSLVAGEQDRVIAEGVKLLQQRDDEIEKLDRRLKAAVDDVQHERRQNSRLAKLLGERDEEITATKASIARACAVPQRSPRGSNGDLKYADKQLALLKARLDTCAGIARVPGPKDYDFKESVLPDGGSQAVAVSLRDPERTFKMWEEPGMLGQQPVPSWSPRPIKDNQRLPIEVHRASAWDYAAGAQTKPKFGSPSPVGVHREHSLAMPPGETSSENLRYLNGNVVAYVQPVQGETYDPAAGRLKLTKLTDEDDVRTLKTSSRDKTSRQRPSDGSPPIPPPPLGKERSEEEEFVPRRRRQAENGVDEPRRRRRGDDYYETPRRKDAVRDYARDDDDRRRRRSDRHRYDHDDEETEPERPMPRRRRDKERDRERDKYEDRGYRSDAPKRRPRDEHDRGYKTDHGRDSRRDRERRRAEKERPRAEDYDRYDKYDRRDRDRRRSDRDRSGKQKKNLNEMLQTGQKHWSKVEPVAKPMLSALAKKYLET
ncbi:hypothetical protein B0A50_01574 [Salinomyces thailandicus]|uniref:Uncharacterized protein n=1 Tax=Salinomyces thailandicus TaxID=706561 RepID=A0A4U0UD92_9PEZI|nr:hypothetical protein B0A50_01574 [Salinomyces thailandica]